MREDHQSWESFFQPVPTVLCGAPATRAAQPMHIDLPRDLSSRCD